VRRLRSEKGRRGGFESSVVSFFFDLCLRVFVCARERQREKEKGERVCMHACVCMGVDE